ncbi:phosphate signaling complex protein PhoU [soil metagenome]
MSGPSAPGAEGEDMDNVRKGFHRTLGEIRQEMVQMAALVTEGIPRATEAMLSGDMTEAQRIIDGDDPLDAKAVELEEICYQQLALQQPMAGDLRGIVTAIRMIAEIERSGDLVVNIAKGSRRILGTELSAHLRGLISQMGGESTRLFRMAIDSYVDEDAGLAAALDDLDDRLDAIHRDYIQEIFLFHTNGELPVQAAVQLALVGRYYERIGDHAVNIGERVRYMVTGWLPEHTGAAREAVRSDTMKPET